MSENDRKTLSMALVQCHFDCVSGVNKTVKKELHVMQNKIIRFITGFDNRKRVNRS